MKSAVSSIIGQIYEVIHSGFEKAVSYIKGLASSAFGWGRDLIMGIVDGIKSAVGAVTDAVTGVADDIRSVLHFSVPDEGPLTDYESWMPDFMSGLAKGIEKSRGMVQKAVNSVASDMVISPKVNTEDMTLGTQSISQIDGISGMLTAITSAIQNLNGSNGDIVIPVYLGGNILDEVIVSAQQRANLRSGGR